MRKVISPTVHRVLDFVTVIAFAAAPPRARIVGPARVRFIWAGRRASGADVAHTVLPRGGSQPLALKIHGVVEMLVGPVLPR